MSKKLTVDQFLARAEVVNPRLQEQKRGRLMFALDATASRQPTWDQAAQIQGDMFVETAGLGALDIQLVFFRGFNEFKVSNWINNAEGLLRLMARVFCAAGQTQIRKVLQHAVNQAKKEQIDALIFIGDSCEEDIDPIAAAAGELGLVGVPVFLFHEGTDPIAEYCFREISRLTGGAYCHFDSSSGDMLKKLLCAIAVYTVGGKNELEKFIDDTGLAALLPPSQFK